MRRDDRRDGADRDGRGLLEHAVDAVADPHLLFLGLEVDVGGAALDGLLDHPVHELDDRRVLAAGAEVDRRVLAHVVQRRGGRGAAAAGLGGVGVSCSSGATAPWPKSGSSRRSSSRSTSASADDRGADLVAGHDRDVVDREHVGGVDHRHQQRAVADEGDRARPGSGGRRRARRAWRRRDRRGRARGRRGRGRSARRPRGESWSSVSVPSLTSTRSGAEPFSVPRSIARSIVPRSTKPRSTITSVSTRPEPPRREGVVMPLPRRAWAGCR